MSTTENRNGYEIHEGKVMIIAPKEYGEFIQLIEDAGLNLETVAEAFKNGSSEDIDFYWECYNMNKDGKLTSTTVYEDLYKKFEKLSNAVFAKTNILLSLYIPSEYVLSGENRVYWVIDNAYIRNEAISEEYVSNETRYSVVVSNGI